MNVFVALCAQNVYLDRNSIILQFYFISSCDHILNLAITKGVRDYIHVLDLADGHSAAVQKLEQSPGLKVVGIYL